MSLVLAAADDSGIYIAGDSAGCVAEQAGCEHDFVKVLGTRIALAVPRAQPAGVIESIRSVAWNVNVRDVARALCDRARSGLQDGTGFAALVCGFDRDGQAECFAVREGNVVPASLAAQDQIPAVLAAGIHCEAALAHVRGGLDKKLPLPSALRCGINGAISFEEDHVFDALERRLRLPAKVFRFDLYGTLTRVL
jgi:hypothetical protein